MTARALICGIGNVFCGDDGFGSEVAARMARGKLPAGVVVKDFGIRAMHLAYELLEPPALLVVADAVARGELPGTLYLLEPEVALEAGGSDPHGMDLQAVFRTARALGAKLPRTLIVGCEPAEIGEQLGLSGPVAHAIEGAILMVHEILERELGIEPQGKEIRS